MIIVELKGGHSNQVFQYATGRALAEKYGTELKLDISWFEKQPKETKFPRRYEINCYGLRATIASKSDLKKVGPPIMKSSLLLRLLRKVGIHSRFTIVTEKHLSFDSEILESPDNSYLRGYWQNENYFLPIRELLIRELEPLTLLTKQNQKYLEAIQAVEAISLHIRREDYVGVQEYSDFHGLTPLEYYQAAYNEICRLRNKKSLPLFVFSTDIDWCKENLKFDTKITYVEGNTNGSDDMRLMKHCKHNIMANSSFSWWGAWLNNNPEKVVVATKIWFQDKIANQQMELPKNWIRL